MITYKLVAVDTDSIKFYKSDMSVMTKEETELILKSLNDKLPELIRLENDGIYDNMIVAKTKNYMTQVGDKIEIKGSALKATMKETALKDFLADTLKLLLKHDVKGAERLYTGLAKDITQLDDITPWCSKKTVTKAVLQPKRTNEQRVLDALDGENIQEGDKVRMFFKSKTELCLDKNFDGVYDEDKLLEKLFKTVKVLENVVDMDLFLNYKLKRNKPMLEEL